MWHGNRWNSPLAGACLLVALVADPVGTAGADESPAGPAPRDFGGHLFIPSTFVPDPFISTSLTTSTGGGSAVNLAVPIYNLRGDKIGETSSDIGFMQLGIGYQQAVSRRVALRVDLNGGGRMGTTANSLLAEGISAIYGYGIGATVSLVRKPAWQLSATADLRGNTLYGVSPYGFVRAVVNSVGDGDTTGALEEGEDSLLTKGENLRALGGVRAAYTPAAWIGFTGFLEAGLGDEFQNGSQNIGVTNFGVTASFDLNPLKRIPVGLLGAFRNESLSEKDADVGSSQTFGLGVFYTGRRFFSVGLDNTWSQISQAQSGKKVDVTQTRVVLRYDFK